MTNADPMKCECIHWCRDFKPGDLSEDRQRVLTHNPRCAQVEAPPPAFVVLVWEGEPQRLWQVQHPDRQRVFHIEWEDCCNALDAKEGGRVWDLPQIAATLRCRGWQIRDAGEWSVVEG